MKPAARREPSRLHPEVTENLCRRLTAAFARADRTSATTVVTDALAASVEPAALLFDVLGAAQREIGARWHRGELSVAGEHWSSELAIELAERVRQAVPSSPRNGLVAVLATPQGERHAFGSRLIAALLQWRGWHTHLLGGDVPAPDLASFAQVHGAHLVALSVTLRDHLPAAAEACERLLALTPAPKVMVGGGAFGTPPALPAGFPAEILVAEASDAVAVAEAALGRGGPPDLATYLLTVGSRVGRLRRERGLSQADLATGAALARSYLSAVEQGRQNITLDAALRLASVLAIPVAELLREEADPR